MVLIFSLAICLILQLGNCLPQRNVVTPIEVSNDELKLIVEDSSLRIKIVDLQDDFHRQRFGYLPGSLLGIGAEDISEFNDQLLDYIIVQSMETGQINEEKLALEISKSSNPVVIHKEPLGDYEGEVEYPYAIEFKALEDGLKSNDILVIDVRTKAELIDRGKIPGTYNVPFPEIRDEGAFKLPDNQFEAKYGFKKPGKKDSFVLTCKSGVRARAAQIILSGLGYKSIRVYLGSFDDWEKNGGEIIKGGMN